MSDIGIVGGTFDPIHNGHIEIAKAALRTGLIEKVLMMPAKVSPFKIGREMAGDEDRFNMVTIAVKGLENVEVSRLELDNDEISYTFRTLTALKELHPENEYSIILGSDQFLALESWYKGKDILEGFPVILAGRPGFHENEHRAMIDRYISAYGARISFADNDLLDISSTEIKERLRSGEPITGLVPEEVEEYIDEHGLYR